MAPNPAGGGADGGGNAGVASEPGSGGGSGEGLKSVAGLTAVAVGLVALTLIAILGMSFVSSDNPSVVAIATGSFTVIGTIVGAYFGVKAGNDNAQKAIDGTQKAIDGLRDEASKTAAFAAHMNGEDAQGAVATYQALRSSGKDEFGETEG